MMSAPTVLKTSWSLLITGISASMTPKILDPLPAGSGNEWGRGPESASFPPLLRPLLGSQHPLDPAGRYLPPPGRPCAKREVARNKACREL